MKTLSLVLTFLAFTAPLLAQEYPAQLNAALEEAERECADFDNGQMGVGDEAIQEIDLTGDGNLDYVLDEFHLSCSSAASAYCGTGGCGLTLIVGETATDRLSKGWRAVELPPYKVVLIQTHGSECGGTNLNPCFEALVWDPEDLRFNSILAVPED